MRQVYHIVTDFNKCKIPIFTLSFLKQSIFYFKLYYIFEKIKSFFLFFRKKGIIKENKQLQNKRKKLISQQKEEERKKKEIDGFMKKEESLKVSLPKART